MKKQYIVLSQDNILLALQNQQWQLPQYISSEQYQVHFNLFGLHGEEYIICQAECFVEKEDQKFFHLREAYAHIGDYVFQLIGRARQLLDWQLNHQFCGYCAQPTEFFDQNRAKKCPNCGLVSYPRIAPCILVAITRGDEILLAKHLLRIKAGIYTVLAGFVEPGETLEACVRREVKEEVNLEIKNIRYISSQAWPFPNLLMCGFTAEYASGELKIDPQELADAQWFNKKQSLPTLPPTMTLSFQLIDSFVKAH